MKIVFVSNYFNHHQLFLSDAFFSILGENNYFFIETSQMTSDRIKLGWKKNDRPYVLSASSKNLDLIEQEINSADVVIMGSAPFSLIKKRIKLNKLTFVYSERVFKKKIEYLKYVKRFFQYHRINGDNVYALCASAFTSRDYSLFFLYKEKTFKWGYFPETIKYDDLDELISNKKKNSILWVGRIISWKHAELAVKSAYYLKKQNIDFDMTIIGEGNKKNRIKRMIKRFRLENSIEVLDSLSPDLIRKQMEKASVYLFTSDFQEGWGAVLNESMNSACAVIASHAAGSTPFLVDNYVNGLVFKSGNSKDLCEKLKFLLLNDAERIKMQKKAYETINMVWSSNIAAKRLIELSKAIINKEPSDLFNNGPCSIAYSDLKNNWFKEGK